MRSCATGFIESFLVAKVCKIQDYDLENFSLRFSEGFVSSRVFLLYISMIEANDA